MDVAAQRAVRWPAIYSVVLGIIIAMSSDGNARQEDRLAPRLAVNGTTREEVPQDGLKISGWRSIFSD
jgi:hypothetical protein